MEGLIFLNLELAGYFMVDWDIFSFSDVKDWGMRLFAFWEEVVVATLDPLGQGLEASFSLEGGGGNRIFHVLGNFKFQLWLLFIPIIIVAKDWISYGYNSKNCLFWYNSLFNLVVIFIIYDCGAFNGCSLRYLLPIEVSSLIYGCATLIYDFFLF